jgi:hypothetical protein
LSAAVISSSASFPCARAPLDRGVERHKPLAKGRQLRAAAAPPRMGRDHRLLESAIERVHDEPAGAIGQAGDAACAEDRTLLAHGRDDAKLVRRQPSAIREMKRDLQPCLGAGLRALLFAAHWTVS